MYLEARSYPVRRKVCRERKTEEEEGAIHSLLLDRESQHLGQSWRESSWLPRCANISWLLGLGNRLSPGYGSQNMPPSGLFSQPAFRSSVFFSLHGPHLVLTWLFHLPASRIHITSELIWKCHQRPQMGSWWWGRCGELTNWLIKPFWGCGIPTKVGESLPIIPQSPSQGCCTVEHCMQLNSSEPTN